MMFKKLVQKLKIEKEKSSSAAINPIDVDFDGRKHDFLSKMTKNALNLYEKQCDIKNFTKLALSNPENTSHNDIVNEPDINYYGYYDNGQRYLIKRPVCRRNADIWLQLELPDKTTGWVKVTDAHAGANAQPDWWKCYTGFALDCFTGFSPDTHKLLTN